MDCAKRGLRMTTAGYFPLAGLLHSEVA
jgi:hypothetical protein